MPSTFTYEDDWMKIESIKAVSTLQLTITKKKSKSSIDKEDEVVHLTGDRIRTLRTFLLNNL